MRKRKLILTAAAVLLLILLGWRLPVIWKIESLRLPEDCETVYPVKIQISDVYWLHIKGEKVIKCSLGYEAAKEYIEANNSLGKLAHISIYPYGGMSDIAVYDAEFDEDFWNQPDRDNYVKISYFRKLIE